MLKSLILPAYTGRIKRKTLTVINSIHLFIECICIVKTKVVQTTDVKNATNGVSVCYVGRTSVVDGVCFFERLIENSYKIAFNQFLINLMMYYSKPRDAEQLPLEQSF